MFPRPNSKSDAYCSKKKSGDFARASRVFPDPGIARADGGKLRRVVSEP
jgi:hypothetical protein